jgi:hypothetical protein
MSRFRIFNDNNNNRETIDNSLNKLSIRMLINDSFISTDNYFINYIEVLVYNNTSFEVNISDNVVYTENLINEDNENSKIFYLFSLNIPIKKHEILTITGTNSACFRLYFSNERVKQEDPFIKVIELSSSEKSDNIFNKSNIIGLLDDIFD